MKWQCKWLTGAHLKWLAILSMLIDHMGIVLFPGNITLRIIGRFAFPVFCFLLVEGFYHTRSKLKYLRNLIIFAVVSEVPFDLALDGKLWSLRYQNVFFTLALGFIAIWLAEYWLKKDIRNQIPALLAAVGPVILAEYLHTDYGAVGVLVIFIMYMMHFKPVLGAFVSWVVLALSFSLEVYSLPFVLAIAMYNGKRGRQAKYFFYVFYPAHLLLLVMIKAVIF